MNSLILVIATLIVAVVSQTASPTSSSSPTPTGAPTPRAPASNANAVYGGFFGGAVGGAIVIMLIIYFIRRDQLAKEEKAKAKTAAPTGTPV